MKKSTIRLRFTNKNINPNIYRPILFKNCSRKNRIYKISTIVAAVESVPIRLRPKELNV